MPKSKQIDAKLAEYRNNADFITAVQAGKLEEVKRFLDEGISPNVDDTFAKLDATDPSFNRRAKLRERCTGLSALSSAAFLGKVEPCRLLLDAGADPNIREAKEAMRTPLMIAVKNGQLSVMHLLLERGADCLASDVFAETTLKFTRFLKDPTEAKKALEAKIKEQRKNMTLPQAIIHGDIALLKELLDSGKSPNECHSDGYSALFYACLVANADAVDLLLKKGADINLGSNGKQLANTVLSFRGEELAHISAEEFFQKKPERSIYQKRLLFGEAPIFAACELGNLDIVERLLKAGCDVNCATKTGSVSPLMMAIVSENLKLISFLIEAGAKLDHRDSRNASVLDWASKTDGNLSVRNLIREKLKLSNATSDFKDEFKKFKVVEASPSFQEVLRYLMDLCQNKASYPWKKKKGVYRIYVNEKAWDNIAEKFGKEAAYVKGAKKEQKHERKTELADLLQDEVRAKGFLLVTHKDEQGSEMQLLFPTTNKYAVVAACGTNGDNYGRANDEVIQLLTELDEKQPFVLTACMEAAVGGKFCNSLAQPEKIAEFLYSVCPDLADGELICDEKDIAKQFAKTNRFYLWWS